MMTVIAAVMTVMTIEAGEAMIAADAAVVADAAELAGVECIGEKFAASVSRKLT
jgi:hypothetical protein